MSEKATFDKTQALRYGMNYGAVVGILTGVSFLCSIGGAEQVGLSLLSNVLAFAAVYVAARMIRTYDREIAPLSFGQTCRMVAYTYFFAILLTAAIQYVYFAVFDQGRFAALIQDVFTQPQYRQMLEDMANGQDVEMMLQNATDTFLMPASATMQLMWMNIFIALFMLLPTALIARIGKRKQ